MDSDYDYDYDDDGDDYEYDDEDEDTTMTGDDDDGVLGSNALMMQQQDTKFGSGIRMIPARDFYLEMNKFVDETTEITGLSSDVATVLLNQYSWSKDKLIEEYCSGDGDTILKKFGVYRHVHPVVAGASAANAASNNDKTTKTKPQQQQHHNFFTRLSTRKRASTATALPPPPPPPIIKTCPICYEDEEPTGSSSTTKFHSIPCNHAFCNECWYGYVSNAIESDGLGCIRTLKCPQVGCNERLTIKDVTTVLSLPQHDDNDDNHHHAAAAKAQSLQQKYELFQLRSFIDSCDLTCWCPGTDCDMVASAASLYDLECANKEAICTKCETTFCIFCGGGQEAHAPCPCSILKVWKQKCHDDGMNATWLLANTKACPKCYKRIQKNGGCNHMTCRTSGGGCGHEFCWLCLANWRTHRQCNTFTRAEGDDRDKPNDDAARNAQTELERYTHYQERFKSHSQGQQYAQKKWDELKVMEPTPTVNWNKILIARDANKLLTTCRRVLKYTYAYGYIVFGMNAQSQSLQKERFEDRQQQLESFTERLSHETESIGANINDISQTKVADLSGVLTVFIKNMIECIDDDDDDDNDSNVEQQMMMG